LETEKILVLWQLEMHERHRMWRFGISVV